MCYSDSEQHTDSVGCPAVPETASAGQCLCRSLSCTPNEASLGEAILRAARGLPGACRGSMLFWGAGMSCSLMPGAFPSSNTPPQIPQDLSKMEVSPFWGSSFSVPCGLESKFLCRLHSSEGSSLKCFVGIYLSSLASVLGFSHTRFPASSLYTPSSARRALSLSPVHPSRFICLARLSAETPSLGELLLPHTQGHYVTLAGSMSPRPVGHKVPSPGHGHGLVPMAGCLKLGSLPNRF